jgi:hypothetical protein
MNRLAKTICSCAALLLASSGCSDVSSSLSNISVETPYSAVTNLTQALKCMGERINQSDSPAVLLLVDEFFDGTVPVVTDTKVFAGKAVRENGPLADGGKYDFEAVIKRSISDEKIRIPYSLPTGLTTQEDMYGRLSPQFFEELKKTYGAAAVIRVKAIFTQNDSSDFRSSGFGSGADIEGNHGETELEYGVSEGVKTLSLTVQLGIVPGNIVGPATTLTLNMRTRSDEFSIGFGYGEGSMSFAKESRVKEGLHGAQRTLVEGAAMWMLRGIYGSRLDFSPCFTGGGPAPNAVIAAYQQWLRLDEGERNIRLKLMLKELNCYSGPISKEHDEALTQAVAAYEKKDHEMLIPHTKSNLADLFIVLSLKVDAKKIDQQAEAADTSWKATWKKLWK